MPCTAITIANMITKCKTENWDIFYIVYSDEVRMGKSTLNQLIMLLNPLYNAERCVYSSDSFYKMTSSAIPGKVEPVQVDEPDLLYNHVQSNAHKELQKCINRIGMYNMMFGLCTSDLSMIPKYVMYKRTRAIFYVTDRGEFSIIPKSAIRKKIKYDTYTRNYKIHEDPDFMEYWDEKDYLNPVFVDIRKKIDAKKEIYNREQDKSNIKINLKKEGSALLYPISWVDFANSLKVPVSGRARKRHLENSKIKFVSKPWRNKVKYWIDKDNAQKFIRYWENIKKILPEEAEFAIKKWCE